MTLFEAKEFILDIDIRGKSKGRCEIVKHNKELLDFIENEIGELNSKDSTISEKCFWIIHDIREYPKCLNDNCNNKVTNFISMRDGYYKYCCHLCSCKCEKHKQYVRSVFREKFGFDSPLCQPWVKEKCHNEESQKKYKATCLSHGYTAPMRDPKIKNKWINTNIDHNGGIGWQSEDIKHRSMNTNINRYGVPNAIQNKDIFRKIFRRLYYNGQYFGSSYELYFYMYLKRNNIQFEYQPRFPKPIVIDGTERYLFPDFYLIKENKYIDTKGGHFFDENGFLINPFERSEKSDLICRQKQLFMIENGIKLMTKEELEDLGINFGNIYYIRKFCKFLEENKLFYDKDISYINKDNINEFKKEALELNNAEHRRT